MAVRWQQMGAKRIHVVDLDGSRTGSPQNMKVIAEIIRETSVPVQVGGGIRSMKTIEDYMKIGVGRIILGTVALKNRDFLIGACERHKGSIILGIDARDGKVAVEGWMESADSSPVEIAKSYEGYGLDAIIYTDIKRDGMETGVNIESTKVMAESVNVPVIASGGVSGMHDIEKLVEVEASGIMGVITGKALYSGALDLKDAIDRFQAE
jgi:phosphoribosylformimino-5-aminoimidazole carboxamide ribotide isomerase